MNSPFWLLAALLLALTLDTHGERSGGEIQENDQQLISDRVQGGKMFKTKKIHKHTKTSHKTHKTHKTHKEKPKVGKGKIGKALKGLIEMSNSLAGNTPSRMKTGGKKHHRRTTHHKRKRTHTHHKHREHHGKHHGKHR